MSLHRIRPVTMLAAVFVMLLLAVPASAQLDRLLRRLSQESACVDLSDAKIASGLMEALEVGTQNTFDLTSKTHGEQSAPAAKQIFGNAIAAMSSEDVYFKIKTTDELTTAFRPTVERSMGKVGVEQ